MNRILIVLFTLVTLSSASALAEELVANKPKKPLSETQPKIQLAILLDTSSSMSGLINQAKTQLWAVVNEFISAQQKGKKPLLEVSLYEYGKDSLSAKSGYIRQIVALSTNLDRISEELFSLNTNGGSEHCGQVIEKACLDLEWSERNTDIKAIFIAGNESFDQGPVKPKQAIAHALEKGVVVNTVFCGGDDLTWRRGASLADGSYIRIDHNRAIPHIDAPQDKEITRLNRELNSTYIPYGRGGGAGMARQKKQDTASSGISIANIAQRAVSKSSRYYNNAGWDLVDALRKGKADLSKMKSSQLPEAMRKMSVEERKAHVSRCEKKRRSIQKQIQELAAERKRFVAEKMKALNKGGKKTLDQAIVSTVQRLAEKKNFTL